MNFQHSLDFFKSAISNDKNYRTTNFVLDWIKDQNKKVDVFVSKIKFDELDLWSYNKEKIFHSSGKFFSIEGIRVKTNWGVTESWDQPIINQPEVGYLGFITKEINGILHFLTQAKIEPGNINYVQLSPTIQATKSNYTQIHKGNKPKYLEYFQQAKPDQILIDQLQSEQGARFLKKRNRNIIIKIGSEDEIPLYDNYIWLSLCQLKDLMRHDNIVNMDTRTVLSSINFTEVECDIKELHEYKNLNKDSLEKDFLQSTFFHENTYYTIQNILSIISNIKSNYDLDLKTISLEDLLKWKVNNYQIYHEEKKYFKVIAVDVKISNREVVSWKQPMIQPAQHGLCVFVCKKINGIIHFLVQLKLECGNHDIIEMAPTVQTLTGDYKKTKKGDLPFLDYVLNIDEENIVFDTLQSEEGGRFYKEQNRNMIVLADEKFPLKLPEKYLWMTINQLHLFLKFNNYVNIQARNLIASISYI